MNALNRPFQLTSSQKRHIAGYGAAIVVAFFVLAMILYNTNINVRALAIIYLFIFGLVAGVSLRLGAKRGWLYYAERYQPGAHFVFSKKMKLSLVWRALMLWFAGRFVSMVLINQADSDFSLGLLLFISVALVVMAGLLIGLRYGWRSADDKLTSDSPVVVSD